MTAASLVLSGCTTLAVSRDDERALPWGRRVAQPGRAGIVVAAPHGTSDIGTGDMATTIARRTGLGLVVASGFSIETDGRERAGWRYQVNRPYEGVPGRPASEETASENARRVYQTYEEGVRAAAQGPLRFYLELHGHHRPEAAQRIEVATVGIDGDGAVRLRTLFELVRDARLGHGGTVPRLTILVEGADTVRYTASGAKRDGILRLPERASHIELPRTARTEWRTVDTEILADFFDQLTVLFPSR